MRRLIAMSMIQRGLSVAAYVVATMIIARLLTPAEVGVFSLAAAVTAIAGVVREFGVSEYLMQERNLDESRMRAAFGVAIVVGWTVCAALLLARYPIAAFYGEPGVSQVLGVLAVTFAFLPFATPVTALLYRDMRIGRVLWIQTIALVIGHATSIVLAWLGLGYMALAWGGVANSAAMVLMLLAARPAGTAGLPSLRGSKPLWDYCAKFTLSGALETGGRNVHEFVIGRAFGFAALGLYSRANGLFVQFNQNVGRGLSRVLLPNFARQARGGGDLRGSYRTTLQLYTGVTWPLYAVVATLSDEFILVMFGDQWTEAGPLLRLLCIGAAIQAGHGFASEFLGALGQVARRLRITSVATALWVAMCIAAAFVGLRAIALAFALVAAVVFVLYLRALRQLVGFTSGDWWSASRTGAVLAVVAGACAVGLRELCAAFGFVPLATLLFVGAGAAFVWLAGVFVLGHPLAGESRRAWVAVRLSLNKARPEVSDTPD
jgi:O-antigen/teichoic acid export membrane protein